MAEEKIDEGNEGAASRKNNSGCLSDAASDA
jgi:hypothetical protein